MAKTEYTIYLDGQSVQLNKILPPGKTVIAHSGHRDLITGDEQVISLAVQTQLNRICSAHHDQFVLLTGFAAGADRLTARTSAATGIACILLLQPDAGEHKDAEAFRHEFGQSLVTICELVQQREQLPGLNTYHKLAVVLASYADQLLVLWDGVDTGKVGGTSEVVRLAMQGLRKKKTPREVHQLIVRRGANPYPICNGIFLKNDNLPPPGIFEWASTNFPGPVYSDRISWFNRFVMHNENFWRFLLPSFFVLLTIGVGYVGLLQLDKAENIYPNGDPQSKKLNAFFDAVNLITLNSPARDAQNVPLLLNVGRFTGLLFVLNAFIVAFMLAIGSNNKNLLRLFWWKLLGFRNVYVITGLNERSYSLAMALKQKGGRVMVIDTDPDRNRKTEASQRGIRVMTGSPQSPEFLKRVYAHQAHRIFIVEESDGDNIRTLHELDRLWAKYPSENIHCYISLNEPQFIDFTAKHSRLATHVSVRQFNFYENISRKLLTRYPVDRHHDGISDSREVFIFGFGAMGQQLLLTLLQTIHADEKTSIRFTVFAGDAPSTQSSFYKKYPCLWHDAELNPVYEKAYIQQIRTQIFPSERIRFKELPSSDALYFHDENIRRALGGSGAVTMYFCLEEAVRGAGYLQALLPRIGDHQGDLQLFCYFDLPGETAYEHAAYVLNSQLPHRPVILFGRMEEECRAMVSERFAIDDLPALLNYWYCQESTPADWLKNPQQVMHRARAIWQDLAYGHQESSRRAADHIWVKIRHAGLSLSKLQQHMSTASDNNEFANVLAAWNNTDLQSLAEMEQRRWCAEKLLSGFLSLADYYPDAAANLQQWITSWNDPKDPGFKKKYQGQKLHIDLVPYEKLFEGNITRDGKIIQHAEKNKDSAQIAGIPYFLYVLLTTQISAN